MSLPYDKQRKLAEKVADDIKKAIRTNIDDFRKHEVSKEDSESIVDLGLGRVVSDPKRFGQ